MLNLDLMRPQGKAGRNLRNAVPPPHPPAPCLNLLLAALPPQDYRALLPHLQPIDLPHGATLHESGDRERFIYFITAGVVCRSYLTDDGAPTSFALAGSEGVIGMAAIMGGLSTPSRATVLSPGHAYRLQANMPATLFGTDGALPHLLLRCIHFLVIQCVQSAACNRYHNIRQQLCRLLLACADRLESDELDLTHEMLANVLGVRREGVTQILGALNSEGCISCHRAHIVLRDRRQLRTQTCECYAVLRHELHRLLGQPRSAQESGLRQYAA